MQIFRAYCLACHNVDGSGAIVRPGMPDIPDFTVGAWHTTKKDDELSKSILSGGKFMPPMKDKLTPADADKMAEFIRAFQGRQASGGPGKPGGAENRCADPQTIATNGKGTAR